MILGEIVSYACGKAGRSDDGFKAKVRTWAALRRDMLWQQQLWKDALAIYTKAVAASQTTVYLPAHLEKIVAAKHGEQALLPVDQVFLFNDDPGVWDRAGTPLQFSRPAASGVAVAPASEGEKINLVSSNAADVGKKVSIYGELAGEEVTELVLLNGTSAVQTVNNFSEVWQLSKEATAGAVTATGATSAATLVRLAAEQTEKRHPRLRLHETPGSALTLAVLAKRLGTDAAGATPVLGMAYMDTPALEWLVRVKQSGASRVFQKHDSDNSTAWQDVALPGGWTIADAPMEIVPALDKVYLFNGQDEVRSWDGTTFVGLGTTASDAPAAQFAAWCQSRMFAAGVAAKPDTVFFCDLLDPSAGHWNHTAKSFRVSTGEGDGITGLARWAGTYLAILKRASLWVANVDPTISLGSQIPLDCVHDSIGCLAHRTVRRVGNDLFFLSDDGVRSMQQSIADKTTNQVTAPVSEPLKDLFARLNKAYAHTACAESFNGRYLIAFPIDNAETPNVVAVFNERLRVWEGYWTGQLPTVFVRSYFAGLQRLNWGQSDGRVMQWRNWVLPANETGSDFQDAGADIPTTIDLRSHNFTEPKNDKKGVVLELEFDESRASAVTVTAYRDEASSGTVLGVISSGLSSGITFPISFPLTFPAQGIKREPMALDDVEPFRELAIRLSAPAGKLALRSARLTAFLETMPLGR